MSDMEEEEDGGTGTPKYIVDQYRWNVLGWTEILPNQQPQWIHNNKLYYQMQLRDFESALIPIEKGLSDIGYCDK